MMQSFSTVTLGKHGKTIEKLDVLMLMHDVQQCGLTCPIYVLHNVFNRKYHRQQEVLQAQDVTRKTLAPVPQVYSFGACLALFSFVRKGIWQSSVPTCLALWVLRAVLPAWLRRWQVAGSSLKQCWLKRRKCFRLKIEPGKQKDELKKKVESVVWLRYSSCGLCH